MSHKHNANRLQGEIVYLVKDVGFYEINKSNVEKLLKSQAKPSSNVSVTK